MFRIKRNHVTTFNMFCIPILLGVWIVSLIGSTIYNGIYTSCTYLPIIFVLGYCFFFLVRRNSVLDIHLLILFLFFIKLYLLPIPIIINGGFNLLEYNSAISFYILDSIILQTLEWFSIIAGLCFIRVKECKITNFNITIEKTTNKNIWRFILFCVFIIVCAIVIFPSLLYKFRPIFFSSETEEIMWKQSASVAVSTIHPIIYYPINWLITVTRLSIVYLLIILIWKKAASGYRPIAIILSLVVIIGGLVLIVPDDVSASIMAALSILALTTKLYPKYAKKIIFFVIIVGAALFIYMFLGRAFISQRGTDVGIEQLSKRLNAYFSGFVNSATVYEMRGDKFTYFWGDFFRSFPVIKVFFVDSPTTTELFNQTLGYDTIYNSQIIPLESQVYFYFGYVGVLVIPWFVLKVCFKFYNKLSTVQGTYDYFINCFFSILIAFGTVMYDSFLIFYLCLIYVPLLFINIFIKRKGLQHERIDIS